MAGDTPHHDGPRRPGTSAGVALGPSPGRPVEIARRLAELDARIVELREHRRSIMGRSQGSTPRQVTDAVTSERTALLRLDDAVASAARALRSSATAHDRAAHAHEHVAARGVGDVGAHERSAGEHRAAAELDRVSADAVAEAAG